MRETYIHEKVTYTLKLNDKLFVVENVPARVCRESGEQFFSPETVEHLQKIITQQNRPARMIETPVYEYVD
jgi:YgiT-type zinc finger domain-containing protein